MPSSRKRLAGGPALSLLYQKSGVLSRKRAAERSRKAGGRCLPIRLGNGAYHLGSSVTRTQAPVPMRKNSVFSPSKVFGGAGGIFSKIPLPGYGAAPQALRQRPKPLVSAPSHTAGQKTKPPVETGGYPLQKQGPCLPALAGGGKTVGEQGEIGHQGMGLFLGIVLPHRDEKDALFFQQGGDVL